MLTNGVAQDSLSAIELLALCADQLPADVPAAPPPREDYEERAPRQQQSQ